MQLGAQCLKGLTDVKLSLFKLAGIKEHLMKYKQLTQEQRYHIYGLLKAGDSQKDIANEIKVHKSTISREIKRNSGFKGYRPKQAQEVADMRKTQATKKIKMTPALVKTIESKIEMDWSPEQISGRLLRDEGIHISHERIYQHIKEDKDRGGLLYKHLRHSGKKRKKRFGSDDRRGQIKNKISIDERPAVVNSKKRIGDWERDLMIGKNHKQALLTIVERVSKFTLLKKIESKSADSVSLATEQLLNPISIFVETITNDNGKEFADHEDIAKKLDASVFFCHPYSSFERGINENTNGLLRQYFPKGLAFHNITEQQIENVIAKINNRPRKCLNFATPLEVFCGSSRVMKKVALMT